MTQATQQKLNVRFTNPRNSLSYPAQVSPACTAAIAIEQLQAPATGPFLDKPPAGRPYHLVLSRTDTQLAPHQTMADAKTVDNDVFEVRQDGQGA